MSNSKNYNSILFITTLSVYFGLVLVGATPSVLAQQAALTQKFEIQNEREIEDDLDKNPDDELIGESAILSNYKIAEAINNFLEDIKKLESIGKFNSKEDWFFSHKVWLKEFGNTNELSKNSDVSNPWLQVAIEDLISKAEPNFQLASSDYFTSCDGENCRKSSVEIKSTANEFSLSFGFTKQTPEKAKFAAEEFNKLFISKKVVLKNIVNLPIYENTKAKSENNQVFIITNLPRAAIDELLADKDAK